MNRNTDLLSKSKLPSALYVVATPIGNLKDMTFRAIETLSQVDMIYCEDKRQSAILLNHYNITTPLGSYHEHNAEKTRPEIRDKLLAGQAIALISDAGTPLISDPGYKLVAMCQAEGLDVISIPGPSALITALACSGLPSDHFYFGGFLPAKQAERRRGLEAMLGFAHTQIYYETPRRLLEVLEDIQAIMGNRRVCVARELTKTFENVHTCPVADMITYYQTEGVLKGELVLLIEGQEHKMGLDCKVEAVLQSLLKTASTKEASQLLSDLTGISKKTLYNRALELIEDEG